MKLVLQRAVGDCGIAALATLIEQSYEDVYLHAASIEPTYRGKCGVHLPALVKMAKAFKVTLVPKDTYGEDDEGLLVVKWLRGSRHYKGQLFRQHLVVLGHGVIVDTSDGLILPPDEYLSRERGKPGSFLELR